MRRLPWSVACASESLQRVGDFLQYALPATGLAATAVYRRWRRRDAVVLVRGHHAHVRRGRQDVRGEDPARPDLGHVVSVRARGVGLLGSVVSRLALRAGLGRARVRARGADGVQPNRGGQALSRRRPRGGEHRAAVELLLGAAAGARRRDRTADEQGRRHRARRAVLRCAGASARVQRPSARQHARGGSATRCRRRARAATSSPLRPRPGAGSTSRRSRRRPIRRSPRRSCSRASTGRHEVSLLVAPFGTGAFAPLAAGRGFRRHARSARSPPMSTIASTTIGFAIARSFAPARVGDGAARGSAAGQPALPSNCPSRARAAVSRCGASCRCCT